MVSHQPHPSHQLGTLVCNSSKSCTCRHGIKVMGKSTPLWQKDRQSWLLRESLPQNCCSWATDLCSSRIDAVPGLYSCHTPLIAEIS